MDQLFGDPGSEGHEEKRFSALLDPTKLESAAQEARFRYADTYFIHHAETLFQISFSECKFGHIFPKA